MIWTDIRLIQRPDMYEIYIIINKGRDASDTDLDGYPAYPKAGYRISGRISGRIFRSKLKCLLKYEILKQNKTDFTTVSCIKL
jgi:hypothetical protein